MALVLNHKSGLKVQICKLVLLLFLSVGVNVCIGLYLFGEKYTSPEEYVALWVMVGFLLLFAIHDILFGLIIQGDSLQV